MNQSYKILFVLYSLVSVILASAKQVTLPREVDKDSIWFLDSNFQAEDSLPGQLIISYKVEDIKQSAQFYAACFIYHKVIIKIHKCSRI